jgi:TfoX/Sxy family transcriptional regulator of competence genes
MATKPALAAFVLEQLGGERRGVTCRKMFGEYGLHCYGKFFALICDDVFYFKPTPAGEALLRARGLLALAPPYDGAKDYFQIDDLDDTAFLADMLDATVNALPEPKPKKPKAAKAKPAAAK